MENATLISRIEAFCSQKGITATTFGRQAVNDGKLVPRLQAGRTITLQTFQRIEAFLRPDEDNDAAPATSCHVNVTPSALPAEGAPQ